MMMLKFCLNYSFVLMSWFRMLAQCHWICYSLWIHYVFDEKEKCNAGRLI